ncbi:3-isopropylmalate dehydratase small subunit [Nocardia rhamnosiphila]
MQKFDLHTGIGTPLREAAVDTEQIVPAEHLKRGARKGFEDALFSSRRLEPGFVLNREPFAQGSILVAGRDFGIGSSREAAVWALRDFGFRVIVSSRFGDIFMANAAKNGLLTARVPQESIESLWNFLEEAQSPMLTVDLTARIITAGGVMVLFDIDPYTRWRLLEGLDDIAITEGHDTAIAEYEAGRSPLLPRTI